MSEQNIKGLKELQKFMDQVPAKIEKNVMRGALRAGAKKELLPEAQANLMSVGAVDTGELMAGLKIGTRSRGGKVEAYVKAGGPHGYLARWVEYGVKAHQISAKFNGWLSFANVFVKEVMHPGIRARAFLRPALDRSGGAAVVEAAKYMRQRLQTKHGIDTAGVMLDGDEK